MRLVRVGARLTAAVSFLGLLVGTGCARGKTPFPLTDNFAGLPPDSTRIEVTQHFEGRSPNISPDGRLVAFLGWSGVFVYDVNSGTTRRVCDALSPSAVAWSPSGDALAFNASDFAAMWNRIWIVRTDGSGLRKLDDRGVDDQHPIWSRDGSSLVWTRLNRLWQVDTTGGGGHFLTRRPSGDTLQFARGWSSDGSRLLYLEGTTRGDDFWLRSVGRDSSDDSAEQASLPAVTREEVGVLPDGTLAYRGGWSAIEFHEFRAQGTIRRLLLPDTVDAGIVSVAGDRSMVAFDNRNQDEEEPRVCLARLKP
jgi:dipeptidyl aminopeptidase/acylaminoacyl peptidase